MARPHPPTYDLPAAFRENLKVAEEHLRLSRGDLSDRSLAAILGIQPRSLRGYRDGTNVPTLKMLQRLAAALRIEPWHLAVKGLKLKALPALRKRGGQAAPSDDKLYDLWLEAWGKLKTDEMRIAALATVQKQTEGQEWATAPPDPSEASQQKNR